MALPADFSKIYGSTATGGLTPISDVNYAKGWEFVGSNPPTKNDFSYLQNLSDLKSQWLYSNKLQRTDPFGDIKSDGTVSQALSNLGLGGAALLAAPTAVFDSNTGYFSLPVKRNGTTTVNVIVQFGVGGVDGASTPTWITTTNNFVIPFPNACLSIVATDVLADMPGTFSPATNNAAGRMITGVVGGTYVTKTGFSALAEGAFQWLAIGY